MLVNAVGNGRRPCVHYWLIADVHGPTSRGQCKLCGKVKWFENYLPDYQAFEFPNKMGRGVIAKILGCHGGQD